MYLGLPAAANAAITTAPLLRLVLTKTKRQQQEREQSTSPLSTSFDILKMAFEMHLLEISSANKLEIA